MTLEIENPPTPSPDLPLFPVDRAVLFSNHAGVYKHRIERRQRNLLGKVSFLLPFLDEGEKIFHITTGCSHVSILEWLLTGWIAFVLKRSLFIFTNKRIFHVPTGRGFSYRSSIAQIFYGDCREIFMKGRTLVVRYRTGKTEKFISIASREKKKIKSLLTLPLENQQTETPQRTHLCPRCTSPLTPGQYSCPHCHLLFKDKATARKISILCPGGGYFYARHIFLGLADAAVELYLSIFVILTLVSMIINVEGALHAFLFFSLVLTIEKLLTVYHAGHFIKEFIPAERHVEMPRQVASPIPTAPAPDSPELDVRKILSA